MRHAIHRGLLAPDEGTTVIHQLSSWTRYRLTTIAPRRATTTPVALRGLYVSVLNRTLKTKVNRLDELQMIVLLVTLSDTSHESRGA